MNPALARSTPTPYSKSGMKIAAIIPAAGQGERLKTREPKPLVSVGGRPLLVHTLENLKRSFRFHEILVVAAADQIENFKKVLKRYRLNGIQIVCGGRTRAESVRNGLSSVSGICDWVLVHDVARPLVNADLVQRLIQAAKNKGAAIVAVPVTSTVKRVDAKSQIVVRTEDRKFLVLAQTPQIFKKNLLLKRYEVLKHRAFLATDEAALFDGSRLKVALVPGDERNIKITTLEDIELFKYYLKNRHPD